jgi:uncharacterized membrane protein YhfC
MINESIITAFYTLLLIILTFPIGTAILLKFRGKARFMPFFLGAIVYFTFSIIFVTMINSLFINKGRVTHDFLNGNVLVYSFYMAVVVGFMEIIGMFVAFKRVLQTHDDEKTPLMFGLGYTAVALIALVGLSLVVYVSNATALNALGEEGYRTKFADVESYDLDKTIDVLKNIRIIDLIYEFLNMLMYTAVIVSLAVMVFYSVKLKATVYFWIAVIIRALYTIPGSVTSWFSSQSTALDPDVWNPVRSVIELLFAGIAVFMAYKLYACYKNEELVMPLDLFKKKMYKNTKNMLDKL